MTVFALTLAILGFIAAAAIHCVTFLEVEAINYFFVIWTLHMGMYVVFILLLVISRQQLGKLGRTRVDSLAGFARAVPRLPALLMGLILTFLFIHSLNTSMSTSKFNENGVTAEINGKYVLDARGQIIRELSEHEYHVHRDYEMRADSAGLMVIYFVAVFFLWSLRYVQRQSQSELLPAVSGEQAVS